MPGRLSLPEDTALWPDHVAALTAFLAIAGQWRCLALANGKVFWAGLDYAAAQSGLALAGLTPVPDTWNEVRQIEAGAIEEMNRGR